MRRLISREVVRVARRKSRVSIFLKSRSGERVDSRRALPTRLILSYQALRQPNIAGLENDKYIQ